MLFAEVLAVKVGVALNGKLVALGFITPLFENGKLVDPEGNRVELVSGKGVGDKLPGVGLKGDTVCPPRPGLDVPLDITGVCDVLDVFEEVL